MIKHKDHFHGSDLDKIETVYGIKKEEIVSFSANVNPLGLSKKLKASLADKLDVITTYPDRDYLSLRKTIASYCHADYNNIIVGNGSTELISLFIQLEHPAKALIIGPTYSEYDREISLGGGISLYYPLKESSLFTLDVTSLASYLNESIDLLVICNPNNPTSTSVCRSKMRQVLDLCKQYGIFVMIDETYVEFTDNYESITAIPLTDFYNNLIILRGISKFFASPGLRLGYAITGNRDLIKSINTRKNPWTINSLAEAAGQLMFSDVEYIENTKALISGERTRVCGILGEIEGLKVYPPTANFVLAKITKNTITAEDVFDACIRQKLMIRNCSTFPFLDSSYFRLCFMKPEDNNKLLDCLAKLF